MLIFKQFVLAIIQKVLQTFGYQLTKGLLSPNYKPGYINSIGGLKLYMNVNDQGANYYFLAGKDLTFAAKHWEDGEIAYLLKNIKPGFIALDMGANVGFISVLLSKLVGDTGKVYSFEPGPVSVQFLRINAIINNCSNLTIENKAVSDQSGQQILFINPVGESDNQVSNQPMECYKNRKSQAIPAISIDEFIAQNSIQHIDYIKMDIQGSEFLALKGMKRLLTENLNIALTVEYAPYLPAWKEVPVEAFINYIQSFGLKIFDIKTSEPQPIDLKGLLDKYPAEHFVKTGVGLSTTLLLKR